MVDGFNPLINQILRRLLRGGGTGGGEAWLEGMIAKSLFLGATCCPGPLVLMLHSAHSLSWCDLLHRISPSGWTGVSGIVTKVRISPSRLFWGVFCYGNKRL